MNDPVGWVEALCMRIEMEREKRRLLTSRARGVWWLSLSLSPRCQATPDILFFIYTRMSVCLSVCPCKSLNYYFPYKRTPGVLPPGKENREKRDEKLRWFSG